jgi:peptide/nickel transport system permease protein
MANLVLWRSLYVYEGRVQADAFHLGLATRHYPGESALLLDAEGARRVAAGDAARLRDIERFRVFSDGFLVQDKTRPGFVGDARYAMQPTAIAPIWGLEWRAAGAATEFVSRHDFSSRDAARFFGYAARSRKTESLMLAYVIRRLLYAIPILLGVNLLTFALFFVVNTPDDMARMQLGVKRVTPEAIQKWKVERGYDKPLVWNSRRGGRRGRHRHDLLQQVGAHVRRRLRPRRRRPRHRARDRHAHGAEPGHRGTDPSSWGLFVAISFALLLVFFRATALDFAGVVLCVAMMSISGLFYIIGGQWLVSKVWHLVPISGYSGGLDAAKFLILPVLIGVVGGIGGSTRWYRTIFLEEITRDYVRTARAKGLPERVVLFRHVLRNAMIPILTGVVVVIPTLFMGSLLTESFFGIPGLGSYTIDAINAQDFAVVRSMVFIGSVLYIVGLLLTDISYTLADPRVRLQ